MYPVKKTSRDNTKIPSWGKRKMNKILKNEYLGRLAKVRKAMRERNLDLLLIYSNSLALGHILYLSGFQILTGSAVMVLPTEDEPTLFVDVDWDVVRAKEMSYVTDVRPSVELPEDVYKYVKATRPLKKRIGIVGRETMSSLFHDSLINFLGRERVEFVSEMLMQIRRLKSPWEIEMMRRAASIADRGVEVAIEAIKDSETEREISFKADIAMRIAGAEKTSVLLSSGVNTDVPVRFPSSKAIQSGDFVLMDLSPVYNNYLADISRTVIVGEPSEKQKKIFKLVLEVHDRTINAIRAGVETFFIDRFARDLIAQAGYGDCFPHHVGHGIGLDASEFELDRDRFRLMPGMVLTIEPGVYIRGFGGVRIEDDILVTKAGAERLTKSRTFWEGCLL